MPEPKQIEIKDMASRLEARKKRVSTTLLLGARAGWLYRTSHLITICEKLSPVAFNNLTHNKRFNASYKVLKDSNVLGETEVYHYLRLALAEQAPMHADNYLIHLIEQGYFNEIISTNIDDLLEQAFIQAELKEHKDFEVFSPRKKFFHDDNSPKYRIIKLYGDFTSRDYDLAHPLAYLEQDTDLEQNIKRLLHRPVVAIGIDPELDYDLLKIFPSSKEMLHFVNEDDLTGSSSFASLFQDRSTFYITGQQGQYEHFVTALHNHLNVGVPFTYQLARDIRSSLETIGDQVTTTQQQQQQIQVQLQQIQDQLHTLKLQQQNLYEQIESSYAHQHFSHLQFEILQKSQTNILTALNNLQEQQKRLERSLIQSKEHPFSP